MTRALATGGLVAAAFAAVIATLLGVAAPSAPAAAAPVDALQVTHRTAESEVTVQPGDTVEYLIVLTASGEGAGVGGDGDGSVDGVVVTVTPDPAVFDPASLVAVGGDDGPAATAGDGVLRWGGTSLQPAESVELRYQVTAVETFPAQPSVSNAGTVVVDGVEQDAASAEAAVGRAIDALAVTHVSSGEVDRVEPGDVILYTVSVRNTNPVAQIDDITVEVGLDDEVFASPRRLFVDSEDVSDLTWPELSLAGGEQLDLQYQTTAKGEFPRDVDTTSNQTTISVAELSASAEPSVALALAVPPRSGDSDGDREPLGDWQRFALVVLFVFVAFLSGGLIVRRAANEDQRRQLGVLLFTTISLVSATLILAFGSDIGDQAISLLAAIAGYVLGRRDDRPEPSDPSPTAAPVQAVVGAPTGGPVAGAVAVPTSTPSATVGPAGVAPTTAGVGSVMTQPVAARPVTAGAVETVVHEYRRSGEHRRPMLRRSLLTGLLVFPVPIVVSVVWVIDAFNASDVPRGAYLAVGTLTALLVGFGWFMAYLFSGSTGPGGTVDQYPDEGPTGSETPEPPGSIVGGTGPEAGSGADPSVDDGADDEPI